MNTHVNQLLELSKLQHQRLLDASTAQRQLRDLAPHKANKGWLNRSLLTRRQPPVAQRRVVQARG